MTIRVGDRLPAATLVTMGPQGSETVNLHDRLKGRKVVLFALPGAFTGTCSTSHLPSFIRTAAEFRAKGVEEIICLSVNDPFVLGAWSDATGGKAAGITFVGDADGSFTKAVGMDFSVPAIGLYTRSNRYALVLEDGVVTVANVDEPNTCNISKGEELLEAM